MPLGIGIIGRAFAKRAERGLFAGRTVLFGNRVSKNGKNKTRRKWLPNVHNKRVYSEQMDTMVPLRVTAGALRNIDKAGGLDAYVFKIRSTKEDSQKAEQLRQQILQHRQQQLQQEQKEAQLLAQQQQQQEKRARERQEKAQRAARTKLLPKSAAIFEERELT